MLPPLGRVALIAPKADDVGDDVPAACRRRVVEIIPTLIDGGSAVRAVAVEVGLRTLEFDDGERRAGFALAKSPERGIGVCPAMGACCT